LPISMAAGFFAISRLATSFWPSGLSPCHFLQGRC